MFKNLFFRLILPLVLLGACSSPSSPNSPSSPDFTISLSPASLSVAQGGNGTSTLTLTPQNGFAGTVSLSLESAPAGVSLSPASLSVSGPNQVTQSLTLTVGSSVAADTYNLLVRAQSGSLSRTASLILNVQSPSSTAVWTRLFGTTMPDYAYAVAVDGSGYVLVAGLTSGTLPGQTSAGGDDAFVRKYTSSGSVVWTRQFGTGSSDYAYAVAVDASGNVLVAGHSGGALPSQTNAGGLDAFVRKYDANGTELWTRQFGTSLIDVATAVAVDASGNVLVAGFTGSTLPGQTFEGNRDAFVRKYDASGTELWTRQFGTGPNDELRGVAIDASGNVLVAGYTEGTLPGQTFEGNKDAFVRKYDASGTELWTRQFGTGSSDYAYAVAVDASGNVLVAGHSGGALPSQTNAGGLDAFVRKYSSSGSVVWTRQFGTALVEEARTVAVDASGNVLVAGYSGGALPGQTPEGDFDAFVRKYDASGSVVWTHQFGTGLDDAANSVAVEGNGFVLVAGEVNGSLSGQLHAGSVDAFVRQYSP